MKKIREYFNEFVTFTIEPDCVREIGYDPDTLDTFCDELCKALEKCTGYSAEWLRKEMNDQIEDAIDVYGSPICGISDVMMVALELDY